MDERRLAQLLVADLAGSAPRLMRAGNVDLSDALEQHLFLRLRAGGGAGQREGGRLPVAFAGLSVGAAVARGMIGRRNLPIGPAGRQAPPGSGAVLALAGVHCRLWRPIAQGVARRGGPAFATVRCSTVMAGGSLCQPSAALASFLGPRRGARLAEVGLRQMAELARGTVGWSQRVAPEMAAVLRNSTQRSLARIASRSFALEGLIDRLRPPLLITFAEINEWARLVPAVGRAHAIATLDLPHAEAADAAALHGLSYDRIGVFGPRAAAVMSAAGIADDRISQIGAPHLDELTAAPPPPTDPDRRIVFASQYLGGRMTPDVKRATLQAAIATARALAPAQLIVKRHPVERDQVIDEVLAEPLPDGVRVVLAGSEPIQNVLAGAWLLMTAWSNSVFEATLLGVPTLTVNLTGADEPVPFAKEGMSLLARNADEASAAGRSLLDAGVRQALLSSAREALLEHLGPLDGRSAERAADLVMAMLGNRAGDDAGTA